VNEEVAASRIFFEESWSDSKRPLNICLSLFLQPGGVSRVFAQCTLASLIQVLVEFE